jgi:hypothetical protein
MHVPAAPTFAPTMCKLVAGTCALMAAQYIASATVSRCSLLRWLSRMLPSFRGSDNPVPVANGTDFVGHEKDIQDQVKRCPAANGIDPAGNACTVLRNASCPKPRQAASAAVVQGHTNHAFGKGTCAGADDAPGKASYRCGPGLCSLLRVLAS